MTPMSLVMLMLAINALGFCFIPALSRRDIFFANTVPSDFREEPIARETLFRYRLMIAGGFLATLVAVQTISAPSQRLLIPVTFAQLGVSMAAWSWAHRRIRPYAIAPTAVRVASLTPRDLSYPGSIVAITGPFVILAVAALFVYANWDAIPDRFPTHWNASGTPDRWETKTIRSVYRPLVMGVIIIAVTQLQTWFLLRRTRQIATGQSGEAEWRFKRRTAGYGVLSTYVMAVLFSYFATRKLVTTDAGLGWGFWALMGTIVAMSIGFTVWMAFVGQGGQRRVPAAEGSPVLGDASPDRAWIAGIFYFNPQDPAIFVEKRMGLGWTLNYGNKWAWLFTVVVLGVPPLIFLLLR